MSSNAFQPIIAEQRIAVLDSVRGFALLGILLMNIEAFVGPLTAATNGLNPSLRGVDRLADALVYLLVQGKFYALFSLLFGIGFAVMAQRAERAGRRFDGVHLRRCVGLLVIGLLHALLIWSGDVLTSYALLAPALLLFRSLPTRWLPWLALAIQSSAWLQMLAYGALGSLMRDDPGWQRMLAELAADNAATVQAQRLAYGSGSYAQALLQRGHDFIDTLAALPINGPMIFALFLLGTWFVRVGVIQAPERHQQLLAWLRWGALPLGLVLMLLSVGLEPWMDPGRLDMRLGGAFALAALAGPLMCLGYFGWLLRWQQALAWLAPAGRMALSNYLLQSLICTGLFCGYALGGFERLPRAWQIPFVLALFALQVLVSRCWLARFRFGPAEWLWRAFTYRQWPRLRADS